MGSEGLRKKRASEGGSGKVGGGFWKGWLKDHRVSGKGHVRPKTSSFGVY